MFLCYKFHLLKVSDLASASFSETSRLNLKQFLNNLVFCFIHSE